MLEREVKMTTKMKNFVAVILFLFVIGSARSILAQTNAIYPYIPGDAILISTFPDTTSFLNGIFPVDQEGMVEFPIEGKVKISRMTQAGLKKYLLKVFKDYLKFPNLYIKPLVRISLLGGFMHPGLYYVDIKNSLWQAVYTAGGTLLEDGIYDMHWQRNGTEQSENIASLFEKGISLEKMGFQSGDQIWTPSPNRRTVWDTIRDVMPILTFTTSIWLMYNTYQRDLILLSR